MNMLNLSCEIMQHEFYDEREEKSYFYIGRWLSNEKTQYETLVSFLRVEKIQFIYCQLNGFCHRYGLKVYPGSVEEANKLFYSPWRSKLFRSDRNFREKV